MKDGKSLEELVFRLERLLALKKNVTIESPKRLRDKITGRLREHDVVLTFRHGHHVMVTAIECRDRSRKVGVEQVEQFAKKCENTLVNQGVIVSSKGFHRSALKHAKECGIRCLDIKSVEAFPWFANGVFPLIQKNLRRVDLEFVVEKEESANIGSPIEAFEILAPDGAKVSPIIIHNNVRTHVGDLPPHLMAVGTNEIRIQFEAVGFRLHDPSTGQVRRLKTINARCEVEVTSTPLVFDRVVYAESGKETISEAIVASVNAAGFAGQLMLAKNKDVLNVGLVGSKEALGPESPPAHLADTVFRLTPANSVGGTDSQAH